MTQRKVRHQMLLHLLQIQKNLGIMDIMVMVGNTVMSMVKVQVLMDMVVVVHITEVKDVIMVVVITVNAAVLSQLVFLDFSCWSMPTTKERKSKPSRSLKN